MDDADSFEARGDGRGVAPADVLGPLGAGATARSHPRHHRLLRRRPNRDHQPEVVALDYVVQQRVAMGHDR